MRQVIYAGPRAMAVAERDAPTLAGSDVLLRVEACGVCGSDVASYLHGHYVEVGQVMGHESVGTVVGLGPDADHLAVGDRTVIRPLRACGACWYCRRGASHLCGRTAERSLGYGADGAYADLLVIRDDAAGGQVVRIDPETPLDDAVWTEPLAVALHALALGAVRDDSRVLVVGAGPIGLALVAACRANGASVEVVEPREPRRRAAAEQGADPVRAPGDDPGGPVDVVLDASGHAGAIAAAARRVVPGGRVVLVGLGDQPLPDLPADVAVHGAFAFTADEFVRAARLIDSGRVRLGSAVSHRFGLANTGRAIATAAGDERAIKVVVVPHGPPEDPA